MPFSRYENLPVSKKNGKLFRPSSPAVRKIKAAVDNRVIQTRSFVLAQGHRLDMVSASVYGTPDYWWVIAAASGIGWQCQVPPGVVLKVPVSIEQVATIVGY